jgi:MFS family permease
MQLVGIAWHVYQLTGSALSLGVVGLMRVLPIVVFALLGGVLADRFDRRRLLLVTQAIMMLFAALLAGLTLSGALTSVALLFLFDALNTTALAFDGPARHALLPALVPREHLPNALGFHISQNQIAKIVGPACAGLLIAQAGIGVVYAVNAASFLFALLALASLRVRPGEGHLATATLSWAGFREGIGFVRGRSIIFSTMLLDFAATFLASASVLLPLVARDILHVGPEQLGLLYAAESLGALVAAFWMGAHHVQRQGALLLGAIFVYGLATTLFGLALSVPTAAFALFLIGAGDAVSTVIRNLIRQSETPDRLRGRMVSVNMIFYTAGPQLGNFEAGLLAALLGAPVAIVSGGVATLVAVAWIAWRMPALRGYRRP